jgi:hypothetical protein
MKDIKLNDYRMVLTVIAVFRPTLSGFLFRYGINYIPIRIEDQIKRLEDV